MESKLARASHRHRQLAIHQIERQRSAAIRLQPTSLTLPQHRSGSQNHEKLNAIRNHHASVKAADCHADRYLSTSQPEIKSVDEDEGESKDHAHRSQWRPVVSLEEVMVQKKPLRKRVGKRLRWSSSISSPHFLTSFLALLDDPLMFVCVYVWLASSPDSFELVCPPTARVVALDEDPISFPEHLRQSIEEDGEWERIGLDGELEHPPPSIISSTSNRSWAGVVSGDDSTWPALVPVGLNLPNPKRKWAWVHIAISFFLSFDLSQYKNVMQWNLSSSVITDTELNLIRLN